MAKTFIDIPDDLLKATQKELGTTGKRDTVVRSMQEVLAARAREREAERWRTLRGTDLDDPEVMEGAWH